MNDKILFVDDDPNILEAFRRSLGRKLNITTAVSGAAGLTAVNEEGPFAVVLTDMRMPEMNGIEFICAVREQEPDSVCMMLTGNSDQETAVNAVNEGRIFRFLTKPCPQEILLSSLEAGLEQHRLITAEKDLLNKTLMGSIRALAEVLGLVNPQAFARSNRIKSIVRVLVSELEPEHPWQYEIAAILSQIGSIVLPPAMIEKVFTGRRLSDKEQEMYATHPRYGCKLIEHIPRLGSCARMIEGQLDRYDTVDPEKADSATALGAQIIHAATDFDSYIDEGLGRDVAITQMREKKGVYNTELIDILERVTIPGIDDVHTGNVRGLEIWKLKAGMYANEDIYTLTGVLIVPKGTEITNPLIVRLRNFSNGVGIKEPIQIMLPQPPKADAAA